MEQLLSTPRTQQACKLAGIDIKELQVKSFDEFYVPGDIIERQKLRFFRYEAKRQDRVTIVLSERAKLFLSLSQIDGTDENSAAETTVKLTTLDALVGKEARRLEKDLRSQLRYYEIVERANSEQVLREEKIKALEIARIEKREQARRVKILKSEEARASRQARQRLHEEMALRVKEEFSEKQLAFGSHLTGEEQRLDKFKRLQENSSKEKSDQWKEKLRRMKDRANEIYKDQERKAANLIDRFDNKINMFEKRRHEDANARLLRHEETTIRLLDAKEKRQRLQRLEDQRKAEIAEQLDEEESRIAGLIATRDEIMKQRQEIIREQESVKCRPLNIKNLTPGPADYSRFANSINEHPAPKISAVKPKLLIPGGIDFELIRSQQIPPLGAYDPKVMRRGQQTWEGPKVSIGRSEKKTYLDQVRAEKRCLPGPGAYYKEGQSSSLDIAHVPRLAREYYSAGGTNGRTRRDNGIPGPGTYTIDRFTRDQRLKKKHKETHSAARTTLAQVPEETTHEEIEA